MENRHRATAGGYEPRPPDEGKPEEERRTQGNQRTAGKGDKPGGQTGNRRKARREPGGREIGPQITR